MRSVQRDMKSEPPERPNPPNRPPPRQAKRSLGARLLSGGFWMMGARIVAAVSGLLVSMLLARMLTPDQLGGYFIIASVAVSGAMLAQFGTHQAVVRLVAGGLARGDPGGVRRSLRSVLVIALTGAAVVAGGYALGVGDWVAGSVFKSEPVRAVVALTALWIVLRHGQTLLAQTFRGFQDLRLAAVYEGGLTQLLLASLLAVAWIAGRQLSLADAVQLTLLAFALTLVTGGWLLRAQHLAGLPAVAGFALGPTLRLSAPLFVSSASIIVLGEMHLWILGAAASAEQVALYGAGFRLMQLVLLPLSLVNHVIPPMVAELHAKRQRDRLVQVLRVSATFAAIPAFVVLAVLMVFAGDVLRLVYGDYFQAGAAVLVIMALGQAINVFTGSPGVLLSMSDRQATLMRASLAGGLIGVVTSGLLVWKLGAVGAAAGYATGLATQNVLMAVICRRSLGIKTYAGLGQLRSPLFWLRGELARRVQRDSMYRTVERLLRPVENVWCAMTRTQLVECAGDSHVNVFARVNRAGCVPRMYLRGTVVQGATALGLANSKSRTNALEIYSEWLAKAPRRHVLLFLLGEVDVGYLVWKKSEKDGTTPRAVMEEALRRYAAFLSGYHDKGYRIVLVTVPLPAVRDGEVGGAMEALRPGLRAGQRERTTVTLEYNQALRDWARQHGAYLLDLDADLLDPATGLLREEYHRRDRADNHLEPTAFTGLLCKHLAAPEFAEWLRGSGHGVGK